jgi:hypothetical protein
VFSEYPCLAVTEILYDPAAVPDAGGEWFEVSNYSPTETYDLDGFTMADDDGGSFTIDGALLITPESFLVFARSGDPVSNGGIDPDYVYGPAIALGNQGDVLTVSQGSVVVDRVVYESAASPPGAAYACEIGHRFLNDEPSRWYAATTPFGAGDHGTPGEANEIYQTGPCTPGGGVAEHDPPGHGAALLALHPNPCRTGVWVPVPREHAGPAALSVFDSVGRIVARLAGLHAGTGSFYWDLIDASGQRLPPGIYWLRVARPTGATPPRKLVVLP